MRVIDPGSGTTHQENLFFWGPDLSNTVGGAGGIGGLVAVQLDGEDYMVGYDGQGNVLNLLSLNSHTLKATFEYDAFGQTVHESGDAAHKMPFRYQTKWSLDYAPTTWLAPNNQMVKPRIKFDLYDYGLRWYHPDQGRFVNRDPIGESGGLNLYGFVGNDPVNKMDILGLQGTGQTTDPCVTNPYATTASGESCQTALPELPPYIDGRSDETYGFSYKPENFELIVEGKPTDLTPLLAGGGDGGGSNGGGEDKDQEEKKERCRELSNLMTGAANIHNRTAARIERNLNDLGIPVEQGFLPRVGDKIYGGATVGSVATGFGKITGWGFAGKGLGSAAVGIDVYYAYDAHQAGDSYTRNQRLKSAGVGVAALASSNPWTAVAAAVGGSAVNLYESSRMDSIATQERDWLNQDIERGVNTIDKAKDQINQYANEFNELGCNETDF